MELTFTEVDVGRGIPEEYQTILAAVMAANDPPSFRFAQTYYVFQVDGGALLKAKTFQNPISAIAEFSSDEDWTHAVIPYSILQTGAVLSYSVLQKHDIDHPTRSMFAGLGSYLSYMRGIPYGSKHSANGSRYRKDH